MTSMLFPLFPIVESIKYSRLTAFLIGIAMIISLNNTLQAQASFDSLFIDRIKKLESQGEWKAAIDEKKAFMVYKDSLRDQWHDDTLAHLSKAYDIQQKQKERTVLAEQQLLHTIKLEEQKLKKRRLFLAAAFLCLFFLLLTSITLRRIKIKKALYTKREKELNYQVKQLLQTQELEQVHANIKGQEVEALRLAQEIHDALAGPLAGMKLQLEQKEDNYNRKYHEELIQALGELEIEVEYILHSASSISKAKSLSELIYGLAKRYNNVTDTALNVQIEDEEALDSWNEESQIAIYRCLQELITNTFKYAQASLLKIAIQPKDDGWLILVEDNGRGFNPSEKGNGIGRKNINNRINLLGGRVKWISQPTTGTLVEIWLPVKTQKYVDHEIE